MKKIYIFVLVLFSAILRTAAQQSGEITPQGIVYPRYTTATRPTGAITPGTTIFNTTLNTHQYYNGSTWVSITNATGASPWTLTGGFIHNNSGNRTGINTSRPTADLEVQGSGGLLITQPYAVATAAPSAPVTMPYNGTLPAISSPTGRILDPGGIGNYLSNTYYRSYISIDPSGYNTEGFRLTFESIGLGTGGKIVISKSPDFNDQDARVFTIDYFSSYAIGRPFIVFSDILYIHFENSGTSTSGSGFQLLYESLTNVVSTETEFYSEPIGNALYFSANNGSFSTGRSRAVGLNSTAMGTSTANASNSTAIGYSNASGFSSTALGISTASGTYSTALGYSTASGHSSTALGEYAMARQSASVAIGYYANSNAERSMVLSAYSTVSSTPYELRTGFKTYRFFTRENQTTYVSLSEGAASWTGVSDSTKKERHLPVNGENVLAKISGLNLTSWSFKNSADRHYGPMAQDFYAAFGKDAYGTIGTDTTINTGDFDGINLIAIQALEKRTQTLQRKNEELLAEVSELKDAIVLLFRKQEELLSKPETDKHDTGSRPK